MIKKIRTVFILISILFSLGCYPYSPRQETLKKSNEFEKNGFSQTACALRQQAKDEPDSGWSWGEGPNEFDKPKDLNKTAFPFEVYPLHFVTFYKNNDYENTYSLNRSDIYKIIVTGRNDEGFHLFGEFRSGTYPPGFIDLYKVDVVLSPQGKKKCNGEGKLSGYIISEEISKKDKVFSSPGNKFEIWESFRVGSLYDPAEGGWVDINSYALVSADDAISLGYYSDLYWAPEDEYLIVSGKNLWMMDETAVYYTGKGIEGLPIAMIDKKLKSPRWDLKEKKCYMSSEGKEGNFYQIDLSKRTLVTH